MDRGGRGSPQPAGKHPATCTESNLGWWAPGGMTPSRILLHTDGGFFLLSALLPGEPATLLVPLPEDLSQTGERKLPASSFEAHLFSMSSVLQRLGVARAFEGEPLGAPSVPRSWGGQLFQPSSRVQARRGGLLTCFMSGKGDCLSVLAPSLPLH